MQRIAEPAEFVKLTELPTVSTTPGVPAVNEGAASGRHFTIADPAPKSSPVFVTTVKRREAAEPIVCTPPSQSTLVIGDEFAQWYG